MVTGNKYIGKTTLLRMLMSDNDQLASTFGSSGSTGFSNWVGKEIIDPEMLYTKVQSFLLVDQSETNILDVDSRRKIIT